MSSSKAVAQRAALLAIGDEVLRGEISNTNDAFIAERLFELGYELTEQLVVSDDPQAIRTALVRLRAEVDLDRLPPGGSGRRRTTGRSTRWPSCWRPARTPTSRRWRR